MSTSAKWRLRKTSGKASSSVAMLVTLLLAGAFVAAASAASAASAGPQQHGHSHQQHSHPEHSHGHGHRDNTDPLLTSQLELLQQHRNMLATKPENVELAVSAGNHYLELARNTDDLRYLDSARAVLAPWRDAAQVPASVLLLRATLTQFEHQFAAALEDLQRYLKQAPYDQQAWLTKALIHQVQGDYQLALRSCAHVTGLLQAICRAGSLSLTGAAQEAYAAMLDTVMAQNRPMGSNERIWLLNVLADTALRAGDAAKAEKHFKTLLLLQAENTQALVSYAGLLLEQRRYAAVLALLEEHAEVDVLALRQARAMAQLKPAAAATLVAQLGLRVASDAVLERGVHLREAAYYFLYLANAPKQALSLALRNIKSQREPCDIRLVLEAALAADQASAAQPLLEWIALSGHADQRIDRSLTQLKARLG